MAKVGIITTGGTIGSVLKSNSISIDPTGNKVRQEIHHYATARDLQFVVASAFNKNSEDLVPSDWAVLISEIESMRNKGIERIVITHGTDTLAYTASAIAGIYGDSGLRICITGSYTAPSEKKSDAGLAIAAALEAVSSDQLSPSVWVAFRSDRKNQGAVIIPALSVKPMDFDGLTFKSAYNKRLASYKFDLGLVPATFKEKSVSVPLNQKALCAPFSELNIISPDALERAKAYVALFHLYPGIDKAALSSITENRKILILSPFHSGTGPSYRGSGLIEFLMEKPDGLEVFMAQFPLRLIPDPYISTIEIHKAGCSIVKDIQAHTLYTWALLAQSVGMTGSDFRQKLSPWLIIAELSPVEQTPFASAIG